MRRPFASARARRVAAATLLVICLAALFSVAPAAAESAPTRVILSYVPSVSNWGPTGANGVVALSLSEGDVRADLVGLPQLDADASYELWLANSGSGEMRSLARFQAATEGDTTYLDELLPEAIPAEGWDQVLVTVEPVPDADPAADGRHFIAGSIPGAAAELQQFPPVLPETGIRAANTRGAALGGLLSGAFMLGVLGLVRRRRGAPQPAPAYARVRGDRGVRNTREGR